MNNLWSIENETAALQVNMSFYNHVVVEMIVYQISDLFLILRLGFGNVRFSFTWRWGLTCKFLCFFFGLLFSLEPPFLLTTIKILSFRSSSCSAEVCVWKVFRFILCLSLYWLHNLQVRLYYSNLKWLQDCLKFVYCINFELSQINHLTMSRKIWHAMCYRNITIWWKRTYLKKK